MSTPSSPSRGLSLASTTSILKVTANLSPTRAVNICSGNLAVNFCVCVFSEFSVENNLRIMGKNERIIGEKCGEKCRIVKVVV